MRSLLFAFVLVMTTRAYAIPVLVEGPPKLDGVRNDGPGVARCPDAGRW